MSKYCVITTTCDKIEIANNIITSLIEKRLASCCQMREIESTYWWKGKIVKDSEFLIQVKTKKELFKEIEKEILYINDYDTCEIIAYDIEKGNDKFLKWIDNETK